MGRLYIVIYVGYCDVGLYSVETRGKKLKSRLEVGMLDVDLWCIILIWGLFLCHPISSQFSHFPIFPFFLGSPVHGESKSSQTTATTLEPAPTTSPRQHQTSSISSTTINYYTSYTNYTMGNIPDADPDEPVETKPFKFVTGKNIAPSLPPTTHNNPSIHQSINQSIN